MNSLIPNSHISNGFVNDTTSLLDNLLSIFYMADTVQNDWLHAIPKSDTTDVRISLTFRNII